jgi:hypothetical protein
MPTSLRERKARAGQQVHILWSDMRELFIYYRIPVDAAPAAREAVEAMQVGLCRRHPGLSARLLRRPDEQDLQQTWMEIYAIQGDAAGVTPRIEADIAQAAAAALAPFAAGSRHTEAFVPCAS